MRVLAGVATLWLITMVVVTSGSRTPALAYAEGAPPGFSGGFGEESCHGCHFHAEPNSGNGRVAVEGIPERYVPGERYTITVTLTRPGMKLAGFQMTARTKDGAKQAGTFTPASTERDRVGVEVQHDVQYANHLQKGTAPSAAGNARWTLEWTAPQTTAAVIFHVAANAADGDGTAEGDFVYTTVAESASAK